MVKKKKKVAGVSIQEQMVVAIRKHFGCDGIGILGEGGKSEVADVIPTGIDVIDRYILGCGGLPTGRLTEVYSEEGGGKTSFTWACIGGALNMGAVVFLCETENALNLARARLFGVDLKRVILIEPDHMEDVLAKMAYTMSLLPGDVPALGVWDSIASCATKDEIERGLRGKDLWDTRAKVMSQACRVLSKLAIEKRCSLLWVNQVREKSGVIFGDRYVTPCGKAVKFYASIRVQLFPGKRFKNSYNEAIGQQITFLTTKNRLASPYRKSKVRLDFTKGWNNDWSTLYRAKELGLVTAKELRDMTGDELKEKVISLTGELDANGWCQSEVASEIADDGEDAGEKEGEEAEV